MFELNLGFAMDESLYQKFKEYFVDSLDAITYVAADGDSIELEIVTPYYGEDYMFQKLLIPDSELRSEFGLALERCGDTSEYLKDDEYYECKIVAMSKELAGVEVAPYLREAALPAYDCSISIGDCSFEYAFKLLVQSFTTNTHLPNPLYCDLVRLEPIGYLYSSAKEYVDAWALGWKEVVRRLVVVKTIQVQAKSGLSIDYADCVCRAVEYSYMRSQGVSLRRVKAVRSDTKTLPSVIETELDVPDKAPIEDVLNYYTVALASTDPYLQYISYYHVLEYFFEKSYRRLVCEELRLSICSPDFSYDEECLFGISKRIGSLMGQKSELGYGNESEQLLAVFKDLKLDEQLLHDELEREEVGLSSYYAAANVPFCDGHTKISWGSGDGTLKTIRTRVYQTRSALVHSKAIMASSRYTHYQDEDQLSKEIPLVKLIAEQIIDNSSK